MANVVQFGADLLNTGVLGFTTYPETPETPWAPGTYTGQAVEGLYELRVFNGSGDLLAVLPYWGSGQWERTANEPSRLTFTYPYDDDAVQYLVFPNLVYLYDNQNDGTLIDRLRIMATVKARGVAGDARLVVKCEGLLGQLGPHSGYWDYETPTVTTPNAAGVLVDVAVPETVQSIVAQALAAQSGAQTHIGMGYVASAIGAETIQLKIEHQRILQVIRKIHEAVGGWYEVAVDGRFYWRRLSAANTGQRIELEKNMPTLTVERDYSTVRTKVTVLGRGIDGETKITASATNATGVAAYGTIEEIVSDTTIWNEAQASSKAQALVDQLAVPKKKTSIEAIDLSKSDSALDYSHDALELGKAVRLVDSRVGESADVVITRITRDLAVPSQITIEVSDPDAGTTTWGGNAPVAQPDAMDALADVIETIRNLSELDTGIAAAISQLLRGAGDDLAIPEVTRQFDVPVIDNADDLGVEFRDGDRAIDANGEEYTYDSGTWKTPKENLLEAMHRCPTAVTESTLGSSGSEFRVVSGYEKNLPLTDECPYQLDLYPENDDYQFERITIGAVSDRTYTILSRGDDAPELETEEKAARLLPAMAWPAGTWIRKVTRTEPVSCDIVTKAEDAGAHDLAGEIAKDLAKCPLALLNSSGFPMYATEFHLSDSWGKTVNKRSADCPFNVRLYQDKGSYEGPYEIATVSDIEEIIVTPAENEVQSITVTDATGGTFTITISGDTTAPIAHNATAGNVESALEALDCIGEGNVQVTLAGTVYTVTFIRDLAAQSIGLMTIDDALITPEGASVVAAEVNDGVEEVRRWDYTVSERGVGDSTEIGWLANACLTIEPETSDERITTCDIVTEQNLAGKVAGVLDSMTPSEREETLGLTESLASTVLPGDDIQSVGEANAAGTSEKYAREDHVHEGAQSWITADTKANLPAADVPALGYTTSTKRLYCRLDASVGWVCLSHLEA